jgi:phosphoheptose isomerase
MPDDFAAAAGRTLTANLRAAGEVHTRLGALAQPLAQAAEALAAALLAGRKLLCCGNGGSAADSAHLTCEIAGRYQLDRPGFAAIDLTACNALSTALINDFPAEQIFARQVAALGAAGDVLTVFSTSGNSANVRLALEAAATRSMTRIAFLGRDGGKCKGLADIELIVPSDSTPRIQEAHLLLYHSLCDLLDPVLAASER